MDWNVDSNITISRFLLKPGDIILSTTKHPISASIRYGTDSEISHSMLYIGNNEIVEAIKDGVTKRSLHSALADAYLAIVYRHRKLSDGDIQKIIAKAEEYIGRPYDYEGAIINDPRGMNACRVISSLLEGEIDFPMCNDSRRDTIYNSEAKFYCSELIEYSYQNIGIPLTDGLPTQSTPQDFIESADLQFIGVLKDENKELFPPIYEHVPPRYFA